MKRLFDSLGAATGLLLASPLLALAVLLIWSDDGHSPIYMAPRVGRNGRPFRMLKLRTMIWEADCSGVDSTQADDPRITRVGRLMRRFKIDEFLQLWNVLKGDMSLVGPRPNVRRETDLYTLEERTLLTVQPGVTDYSSIVFADLGEILEGQTDPDIAYNQLVRPRKSRLGLFYVSHRSMRVDVEIVLLTLVSLLSRSAAITGVQRALLRVGAGDDLCRLADRSGRLTPMPPPGAVDVVTSRDLPSSTQA